MSDIVERLLSRALPSAFDFVGNKVEALFDPENRHKSGKKPFDYLASWLSMLRPFAYATRDASWGEMEKLLCIVMRNYVEMSRDCNAAAAEILALRERVAGLEGALEFIEPALPVLRDMLKRAKMPKGANKAAEMIDCISAALKGNPDV